MERIVKIGRCETQLLPLLLVTLTVIILISLGIWQIIRLQEKKFFLSSMENNLNNPPINIETFSRDKLYANVKIKGHFLSANHNIHLYGRRSMSAEKDGYYLVTPFQTDDNKIILVARGWFAGSHKKNIDNIMQDSVNEIIGVVLPSEKTRLFVFNNDIKNNVWFTLDLKQASDILGLKLENYYLIMEGNNNQSNILKNLSIDNLIHVKNDHLEYAITWFALAMSLIVIFVIYHWRKNDYSDNNQKGVIMKLKIGDIAPDFSMAISENSKVNLSDLKGKLVILYFYPKDDTPGCTIEASSFNKLKASNQS